MTYISQIFRLLLSNRCIPSSPKFRFSVRSFLAQNDEKVSFDLPLLDKNKVQFEDLPVDFHPLPSSLCEDAS